MKKLRPVIGVLIIALLIGGGILLSYLKKERIEKNPDDTVGNTAGNLNNGGYFCEADGVVYFSNFYDSGKLYRMNPDETDITRLLDQSVQYLNAAGKHLYYFQADNRGGNDLGSVIKSTGLYRCSTNGKNVHRLKRGTMNTMLLVGNSIYYQYYNEDKEFSMYKISTTGKDDTRITTYIANPACSDGTYIYFNGTQNNHALYSLRTEDDSISMRNSGDFWNPVYSEGYIYYMDLSRHYAISRLNLSTGKSEALTNERADFFNVSDHYIFYQTTGTDQPALKRAAKDGSGVVVIAEGIYSNICVTSTHLYFTPYGNDSVMYHCPIHSNYPQEFTAAYDAAIKANK